MSFLSQRCCQRRRRQSPIPESAQEDSKEDPIKAQQQATSQFRVQLLMTYSPSESVSTVLPHDPPSMVPGPLSAFLWGLLVNLCLSLAEGLGLKTGFRALGFE